MQSVVEVVCLGNGKTYNSIYTDPGYCKMVIVQDDEKFPSPRLCLIRKWPNFEGGFGFQLFEDLLNSNGALKIESVVKGSPAEAGGLKPNDVIIEINGDNIEYKSFFRLVEILKEAFNQQEMELLVLGETDADWYRVRNITVNGNFPNIEYCETPYYGYKFRTLDSSPGNRRLHPQQIEFHSNSGKVFRTTLVIDKDKESVYRRIEELPNNKEAKSASAATSTLTSKDEVPLRVYYRRAHAEDSRSTQNPLIDSGHGTLTGRKSTCTQSAPISPNSTLGKSYNTTNPQVDLLHDQWGDLMDKYLDDKYRSNSVPDASHTTTTNNKDTLTSTSCKNIIYLNDETLKRTRSRTQSPLRTDNTTDQQTTFSFLFSGRDDYTTSTAASTLNNRSTNSTNRFKSPTKQPQQQQQQKSK
jgi:hypothetical protein